jgi:hypothetical protein
MRVRANIPSFMEVAPGYPEFVQLLKEHPEKHLTLTPGMAFDPEMVLYLQYQADELGWASTMQVHPDGSADLLRHRPEQLDHAVRWICRTADQDALGMEPCTAEVEGYTAEKAKGNVRLLPAGAEFSYELEIGVLTPSEAQAEEVRIQRILSSQMSRG